MARYLNGATIMTTPTPRSLAVARETGFDGIEARAERLLDGSEELRATASAVRPGEVWSLNGLRVSLEADGSLDRELLETDLDARLGVCRAIGAAHLLAVPPRIAGLSEQAARRGLRDGLEVARERAAAIGVGIAFEFLGFADCPIRTPEAAGQLLEGLEGVELVLDSCHWHASGAESLDAFPVERLAMVHINDAPQKPPPEIEDADRLMPGLGVIRLPWLIAALQARGFAGPWSLEMFNPGYWTQDPALVARRGMAALDDLLARET